MPLQAKIYLVILGLWIVNYLPRAMPMLVLSKLKIPRDVVIWLGFVPAAVLAAIVFPSILMPEQKLALTWHNKYLLAAIPAFGVAIKTRSLVWTLLAAHIPHPA